MARGKRGNLLLTVWWSQYQQEFHSFQCRNYAKEL